MDILTLALARRGGGGSPQDDPNSRVTSLTDVPVASGVIESVGIPVYVSDVSQYSEYGITQKGWYTFARIAAKPGTTVTAQTTVTGAEGYIAAADHIDVAVMYDVAAVSKPVVIAWDSQSTETFIFKATDLAIRNLDYRVTFYVYDLSPYVTWEYALTEDETFQVDKNYYTKNGDEYTLAEVTAGEAVPAETYYNHAKIIIAGAVRNVTYRLDEIVDCPMEFILPEIEDETHGCWFEMRFRHAGEYSMTLTPPSEDVKIATEHTQKETAGINMVDLHYTVIDGLKMWRFLNTHSSIPTDEAAQGVV